MVSLDCPPWEYEVHPQRGLIFGRVQKILVDLREGRLDTIVSATDSRDIHRQMFRGLTPPGHDYYAGHYRGEHYRCLVQRGVRIPSDPRVGFAASGVEYSVGELAQLIRAGFVALDYMHGVRRVPDRDKLLATVAFACNALELFLRIHPYLNGNGHAGRFIVWAVLTRYSYWPGRWPMDPKPPDPPYSDSIHRYRDGDKAPLERFVLQAIADWPAARS